ncbi:TAXI family TRAP transporter solute-binding subunit [Pararhodobacter sp. SW119]|uniref:TAXI family TRAP transporter solute-binding subunit n=1 Tax=Pararhodobacter sp. SW119 TaxID=2780075 RepID=UPI001ADFF12E|nr:TAXI family TRAP transporter solute-binding subunit [Pararhodobacter sp. SW119]
MSLRHVLLGGAAAFALVLPANASERLLIGSTSASSSHYGYFVAVAQLVNERVAEVEASVVETGATLDNLRRIQRRQVDLGLVTTNVAHHALAGTNEFEGQPVETQLLWVYTAAPQNVVVRRDAGITSMAELAGQRLNPGIRGSATEQTSEAVFAALGIEPAHVRGSTTDVVDMIKDNRVIGYVKSGAGMRLDASTLDIATFTPITVLSLTEEEQERLRSEMPDVSIVEIPESSDDSMPAYTTWSFGVGVAASPDLSEETAYQIVKTVMEDETAQANAMAELRDADLAELTVTYGTIPLHPGAYRWFREQGIDVPDHLVPASAN